jgi:hypothetical protein
MIKGYRGKGNLAGKHSIRINDAMAYRFQVDRERS